MERQVVQEKSSNSNFQRVFVEVGCQDIIDHDDDDEKSQIGVDAPPLVSKHTRCIKLTCEVSRRNGLLMRLRILVMFLLAAVAVFIFALRTGEVVRKSSGVRSQKASETSQEETATATSLIHQLGWLGTMEKLRKDFQSVAMEMKHNETARTDFTSPTVDITPLCDLVDYALDLVGFRGVFFAVFDGMNYYVPDRYKDCIRRHGVGCKIYDLWWIWHHVGTATAEKLLRDGDLLLDGTTGERVSDAVALVRELHRMQDRPPRAMSSMSFHAEHGFLWHYVSNVMPDLDSYPLELAQDFCGDYQFNNVKPPSLNKGIGSECYHGLGHAVFAVVAARQTGTKPRLSSRIQLRPHGGFKLSNQAICEGYEICKGAPNDTELPLSFCYTGFKHAFQLSISKKIGKASLNKYFEKKFELCEEKNETLLDTHA